MTTTPYTIAVRVTGRVQGVSFRYYTKRRAEELGLAGWVRNCRDGSVEALVSGPQPAVEEMIAWLHQGSPHAVVEQVETRETEPEADLAHFTITF